MIPGWYYNNKVIAVMMLIVATMSICSCKEDKGIMMSNPKPSVYYWRTTFLLSAEEKGFLRDHKIGRMYVHLFDVVNREGRPMPNATMTFDEDMPHGLDMVPVVFITNDVISSNTTRTTTLASQIIKRVTQMMAAHNTTWHELQIDFDWTQRNQASYFAMLTAMRKQLKEQKKGISTTIRLHQLALTAPPVDYGALMVYNIGRYNDTHEDNSIITIDKAEPYMKHLADYPLPLATALPIYSWNLVFQGDRFEGIVRTLNLADTSKYYHIPNNKGRGDIYLVKRYHTTDNGHVSLEDSEMKMQPGYSIRHEECSAEILQEVREMIGSKRRNALDEVILYHLDNSNIKKYSNVEIENILGNN